MNRKKLTRREFGKMLMASGAGLIVPGLITAAGDGSKAPVVVARSPQLKRVQHQGIMERFLPFLDEAVTKVTGETKPMDAWKSLFSPSEKIGIKLSCLPGLPLSSNHGLVSAITKRLLESGIKEKNIIIWERTDRELKKAGFPISYNGLKTRGTDSFPGDGYSGSFQFAHSVGTRFSRIMEEIDALINVPVLKDHDLSGVSISMKNHYGSIYNPNKFHKNNCNPYIAQLNTHPLIKDKQRLIICDASRIQINNGPAYFPRYALDYGALLVSRDPVALDYHGWQLIETQRRKKGLPSLKEVKREPTYIFTAQQLKLGSTGAPIIYI